jgi:hypothetical protein
VPTAQYCTAMLEHSGFVLPWRDVRASDEERERTAGRLRDAHAEGRLESDELEERIGHAYRARTRGELHALVSDLPGARSGLVRGLYRRAWRAAFVSYLVVNTWMVGIWAATGAGYFWPIWTLLPWGLALLSARVRGGPPPERCLRRGGRGGHGRRGLARGR